MKTICFFSGDITRSGGTEKAASMIANALFGQGKYKVIFLSLVERHSEPFFELNGGIERYALGDKWLSPGPAYLKLIPKLKRFLKERKVDVVIDIDIVLDSLSIPAARGTGAKVLSWEHFNYKYETASFYRRRILKYSVKRSDYVVTLTDGDKKAYGHKLGRDKNISAIYNPIEESEDRSGAKKEKLLITVGQLIKRKGTDLLAEVAKRALGSVPDWKWLVVGDGKEEAFLREFIRRNNLDDRLILTGKTNDVYSYLNKSQIYVMTSRLEGLPMCLLEAKEMSLPIVSFDIETGPGEIVDDGVNGFLIPPSDCDAMAEKLILLMNNDELRAEFSARARDDIEKFQMNDILNQWNAALERITSGGGES